jgi:uncharacterized damage-inducible protein DinB
MTLIVKLSKYLIWANDTIWEIVENLSHEEFNRTLNETGGSIHRRYIHLAQDSWEWFHDWHGEEPEEPDFMNMKRKELYQFITEYAEKWFHLIEERTVNEYQDERAGKALTLSFEEMFFHIVNHFTYHRGQIVMALKLLGKEVTTTDYVPYRISTL